MKIPIVRSSSFPEREQECVDELLDGVPETGENKIKRDSLELIIRAAFNGGAAAAMEAGGQKN